MVRAAGVHTAPPRRGRDPRPVTMRRAADVLQLRRHGARRWGSALQLVGGLAAGALLGTILIPSTQDEVEVDASTAGQVADGQQREGGGQVGEDGTGGDAGAADLDPDGAAAGSAGGAVQSGPGAAARGGGAVGGGGGDAGAPTGPFTPGRGVSADKIRIGVAYPDLAAFARVSEDFNVGDQREQMDAVLAAWRRDGVVPVHGRDIELVYREFDIFSADEKIAACNGFVKDDQVFAVIAGRFFDQGAECVTERFRTPLITPNSAAATVYERSAPYYFTLRSPWERLFRNWVHWADVGGHLEGKSIGLFYESGVRGPVATGIRNELTARGYEITEEVEAEGAGIGSNQDQLAVQRFRQAGVDLVMLVVGGTSVINFTTFAESQRYRPTYIDTDYGEHTTDAAASALPPDQYDGTFAMTATRVGELAAGMPLSPATSKCVSDYREYSGRDVTPARGARETAEYNNVLITCDMANVMLQGLVRAGPRLDAAALVRGMGSIADLPLAAHGDLSFGADRTYGVTQQRTVQWKKDCGCWRARGPFTPFAL